MFDNIISLSVQTEIQFSEVKFSFKNDDYNNVTVKYIRIFSVLGVGN